MRKFILLAFFMLGGVCVSAQENYALTVKVANVQPNYKAFLFYKKHMASLQIDSVDCIQGQFNFKGSIPYAQRAYLYVVPGNSNFLRTVNTTPGTAVYLENGNIQVTANNDLHTNLKVFGTPLNEELQAYNDVVAPFDLRYKELNDKGRIAHQMKDSVAMEKIAAGFMKLSMDREKAEKDYFETHLDSEIALEWLKKNFNVVQQKSEATAMFNRMSEKVRNSVEGKKYRFTLDTTPSVGVDKLAPEFTAKNLQGADVSLKMFRGKYVLLDFWASWCGPCRRENPNVLKAYEAYKDKNFTVLGFSMDQSEQAWKNAVIKDNLPWMQVSDLKGWASSIAKSYGVEAIPSNMLIAPNGIIIAQNLRGEALEKKLAEILK